MDGTWWCHGAPGDLGGERIIQKGIWELISSIFCPGCMLWVYIYQRDANMVKYSLGFFAHVRCAYAVRRAYAGWTVVSL